MTDRQTGVQRVNAHYSNISFAPPEEGGDYELQLNVLAEDGERSYGIGIKLTEGDLIQLFKRTRGYVRAVRDGYIERAAGHVDAAKELHTKAEDLRVAISEEDEQEQDGGEER
jgi:hypothetical protein